MRLFGSLAAVVVVLAPLALAGCKQGVGDRCQVMSDCQDGLMCVLPAGGTPQSGGTCQPSNLGQDASMNLDGGGSDGAPPDFAAPPNGDM